jgi:hypothetical protein
MQDTITRYLEGIVDGPGRQSMRTILTPIADRLSTTPLNSSGLVINGAGNAAAKTGASDFYASVTGDLVKIASGTAMPALVGSITATKFNVFCFYVDSAGTTTVAMGTEGAALANVVFPNFPQGKALIGFIIVTYASTFVGGTTALDTATTVYVSPSGPFDPTVLV